MARPSKQTPESVKKLEEAFAMDATVEEACFYAGISRQAYYEWIKESPELGDRFEALRNNPVLKARKTVVESLNNPDYAFRYLERKKKDEFAVKTEIDHTTKGKEMPAPILANMNVPTNDSHKENSQP